MVKLDSIAVTAAGSVTFTAKRNCYYTLTSVTGRKKPALPSSTFSAPPPHQRVSLATDATATATGTGTTRDTLEPEHNAAAARSAGGNARPAAFPLPYKEDFEGRTVGSEAPFFGDQEGKWETVSAGAGRAGLASQQQLPANKPWPILEPQCNNHLQPISIIGDLFFESNRVSADVLVEEEGVGAGLALRIRNNNAFFRGPVRSCTTTLAPLAAHPPHSRRYRYVLGLDGAVITPASRVRCVKDF